MSSRKPGLPQTGVFAMLLAFAVAAWAQHDESAPRAPENGPATPPGMTLEEVFNVAESSPPDGFPEPVPDDRVYVFTLFEQLEYRVATDNETADQLGWEVQGWIGGDYEDRWSGVIALQGLAPYKVELDNSLYISEEGDVTLAIEAEHDLRITQRLVLQPRAEIGFAFQNIPERSLGAGMTDVKLDLRLRYEIKREFSAYFGVRSQFLVGDTDRIAEANGEDSEQLYLMAGLRVAIF